MVLKDDPGYRKVSTMASNSRRAEVERNTKETQIRVAVDLDGSGTSKLATGIGFFDHMLEQIARHGAIDLTIEARGDLHIDGHHTVEDVGITFGQALTKALGDKSGIRRYGHAYVPLDEALSRVVIDLSGRPGLEWHVPFTRAMIGGFDVDLAHEFFQGFSAIMRWRRCTSTICAVTTRIISARRCSRHSPVRCAWRLSAIRERWECLRPRGRSDRCCRLRHGQPTFSC